MTVLVVIGVAVFAVFEGVTWFRRKPSLVSGPPQAPGVELVSFALKSAPAPAVSRVWTGKSTPVELKSGETISFWTRVEPMSPTRLAELANVTLAVQAKSTAGVTSDIMLCTMYKVGAAAWTEPCGGDAGSEVCLRTATDCVVVTPANNTYTVEASVEWAEGHEPTNAQLETFVRRAR